MLVLAHKTNRKKEITYHIIRTKCILIYFHKTYICRTSLQVQQIFQDTKGMFVSYGVIIYCLLETQKTVIFQKNSSTFSMERGHHNVKDE